MSQQNPGAPEQNEPQSYTPSKRDLLRPVEYIAGAAIAAVFVGVICLMGTRSWLIAVVGAGIAFIAVLMTLALLQMSLKPDALEQSELGDGQKRAADAQRGAEPAAGAAGGDGGPVDDAPKGPAAH